VTPLGLLNVLNYITLLPVVVFFLFYALCVFYVAFCLRLFTLVYVPFVLFVLRYKALDSMTLRSLAP